MNWILVFSILQIIQHNWAAPVEPVPTDLHDSLPTELNNTTKKWENMVHTTEPQFDVRKSHNLLNSTLEVPSLLEQTTKTKSDEVGFVTKATESEVSDNENKTFSTTTQNLMESNTNTEKALQETTYSSNHHEFQFNESSIIENYASFQIRSNEKDKNLTGSLAYERKLKIEETTSLPAETSETLQQSPIFKQAIDSFVQDVMEIDNKLGDFLEEPVNATTQMITDILGKEINRSAEFTTEKSMANDLKQALENVSTHSQNLTEYTTQIYNIKPEETIDLKDITYSVPTSAQEFATEPTTTLSSILERNENNIFGKQNYNQEDQAVNAKAFTNNKLTHENSSIPSATLKQPIDAFVSQLSTIEQSIEKSVDKLINSSSSGQLQVQSSELQSNINGSETKQFPAFKEAIDAFIEDIIEVGEKLGLTSQSSTGKQVVASNDFATGDLNQQATTAGDTKFHQDNQETFFTTFKPVSDLDVENLDQTSEYFPATTTSYDENLYEKQSRNRDISTTPSVEGILNETITETIFENSAQETTNIVGKTATETYSASKINTETAANEPQDEKSTETNSSEGSYTLKLENVTIGTLEYVQEKSTNTDNKDQQNIEVLNTTLENLGSTTISPLCRKESPEKNDNLQAEEKQSETIRDRQQSQFESKQLNYQTDPSKDIETQQLEATSTKSFIRKNEAFRLDELTDKTDTPINESTDDGAFIATTHQVEQVTPSIPISRLSFGQQAEEMVQSLATIEAIQKKEPAFPTSTESFAFTTESNTIAPVIETTFKTPNSETTHSQLENFNNSLQQAFHNIKAFEIETVNPKQDTTTTENPNGQTFFLTAEAETSTASLISKELHDNIVTRQDLIEEFTDNYAEKLNTSMASAEKELLLIEESSFNFGENTNTTTANMTTSPPSSEKLQMLQEKVRYNEDVTTVQNGSKELLVTTPTANSVKEENSSEMEPATTEYNSEATTQTNIELVRVPLQKDFNNFSLNVALQADTAASPHETTSLGRDPLELSATTESSEPKEETAIFSLPETLLKEIVTFMEVTEAATRTTQLFDGKNQEYHTTTEIQQTQTDLIQEQQQQIESTTENAAQIESTDASEQTAVTTIHDDTQTEQQTTEAEINSTTVVEEYETTATPNEPEARSLSLPPKLEYSQSDEGVEVFYGYSSVKHN